MKGAQRRRIITLLSDFGNSDWYVACIKGVILSRCPDCILVDLTHEVPPGDIFTGALVLKEAVGYFPPGTVHLAVVDPGVGTSRRPLAARGRDFLLVGPDNGLLSLALGACERPEVREIRSRHSALGPASCTFHGRDLFAPVAAELVSGLHLSELGPEVQDWMKIPWEPPQRIGKNIIGHVVHIDRFGNGITNISGSDLGFQPPCPAALVEVGEGFLIRGIGRTYADAPPGQPIALVGSSGLLEIALNGGSAKEGLGLERDRTRVTVKIP